LRINVKLVEIDESDPLLPVIQLAAGLEDGSTFTQSLIKIIGSVKIGESKSNMGFLIVVINEYENVFN